MKVGKLAIDIGTRDEASGVKSVDLFYQISEGNGKSVVVVDFRCYVLRIFRFVWTIVAQLSTYEAFLSAAFRSGT